MIATDYIGISTLIGSGSAAFVSILVALRQTTTRNKIDDVHREVTAANGISGTELLERAEGRRVEEIPKADRTPSEQGYVDRLAQGGRDRGHERETT